MSASSNYAAGRAGDPPAATLGARLRELKLPAGRLKTGTPPRIDGRTIDLHAPGRAAGRRSAAGIFLRRAAATCIRGNCLAGSRTPTPRTHEIIRGGLDRSPMFTGVIEGIGPRYCPSIEDKITRFAGRDSHQVFLEPEGLTTHEVYPNGISTSLPFDVQLALVRSIEGLEHAHILRPGYAIEYDYFDPRGAEGDARDQGDRRACFSPARSTARPATRKPRRRGCWPASTRRFSPAGARAGVRAATRPISACWSTI